ncbi:hypothetical protein ACFVYR_30690 [Streptomyces sp. NPDC058284]|uniref:hypothetical protein n=1 Tax=unclassified Streptomyces TaxID=2593676 RepID=UPI0036508512
MNVLVAAASAAFGALALLDPSAFPGTGGSADPGHFAAMYGVRSLLIAAAVT